MIIIKKLHEPEGLVFEKDELCGYRVFSYRF